MTDMQTADTSMMSCLKNIYSTGAERTRFQEIPIFEEGLYELGKDLYAWMVPNGSWGESNSGLVLGTGKALLVDTLWDVRLTRDMLSAMETVLKGVPLTCVVNTHADGDHFWGNELVSNAEIISSQAARDEMLKTKPLSLILLGMTGRLLGLMPSGKAGGVGNWFERMVSPYVFRGVTPTLPRRTFTGELTIHVGGRTVELM
ncbi:MBL fold metallo-hydrolase, partial [bacterium]|nr:MBL fold metallo-hydrolase [bacterium]